jgi:isopentenyl diphosphate isomerase/L-lactate dehydrogenase-like FMN-dependent dehydrogenase
METIDINSIANLNHFEELAESVLPQYVYEYYFGGANDEITLSENKQAFQKIRITPRVMVDVSKIDTSTTVFGQEIPAPILFAPTAFHGLATPRAEAATAIAATISKTIMVLSTLSNTRMEDVAAVANTSIWFQLYVYKDRELTRELIKRAEESGFSALCITVDAPLLGNRERDTKNKFTLPDNLSLPNILAHTGEHLVKENTGSALATYFSTLIDQSLNWNDIDWIRGITNLPLILKGIQHPSDGKLAVQNGANAIIVSNHGGRQLDTVPATIALLPKISETINGEIPIFLDGGIRRGTDIIKALAFGAQAVLIGRPILWGLALGGAEGASRIFKILEEELKLAMALSGKESIKNITPDIIWNG